MDHWRESIIPFPSAPASNIFRIAHTPRFGAGATPLSIPSLSPPPPVCIRYDVTPFVSPSPLFPHAIHLPNFADQTYVHCSQYSLPVMLSKGMNCSSVERNWWLSRGARFAIYYQQIDYLRSRRLPRLCGRVTLRKGLFDSQEEGKFVDTTSGINWDPVIIAIVIPVLEMFELILIEVNFMFWLTWEGEGEICTRTASAVGIQVWWRYETREFFSWFLSSLNRCEKQRVEEIVEIYANKWYSN